MTDQAAIAALAGPFGLMLAGVGAVDGDTVALLAPDEPRFWLVVNDSPEFADGQPDPIDRWSKRVIGSIAAEVGGTAIFPSDGPPYPPFYSWATASGRAWPSPVALLVHAEAGLFISFRGAIRLSGPPEPRPASPRPCDSCAGQPCRAACPVGALGPDGYDVARCHDWLDRPEGADCLASGCLVRRACPVGAGRRSAAQSAYHMRMFHP